MRFPRLSYWLVCSAIVLALLFAALGRREKADAPPPPPPLTSAEGAVLAQTAPIDPAQVVKIARASGRAPGTAFSVADSGVWLTAANVVTGCADAAVEIGGGEGVDAKVHIAPGSDIAVLTSGTGAPALALAARTPAHGALTFVPGFLGSRPAEVATRLMGDETLFRRDRAEHSDAVQVFAEIGRTEGLTGPLTGLIGARALDGEGRVVGLILGEAPRRGRLYAAPLAALSAALAAAKVAPTPNAAGLPITPDNYGLAADDLRRALRVAGVVCVK